MSLNNQAINSSPSFLPPLQWIGRDGMPLDCKDKIATLNENLSQIHSLSQQAFEDAVQMGCSEEFLRIVLQNLVDSLKRNGNRAAF
ncbi:MAG: hypothetical protein WCL30_05340 [Pseudomonadota bacterium]